MDKIRIPGGLEVANGLLRISSEDDIHSCTTIGLVRSVPKLGVDYGETANRFDWLWLLGTQSG